MVIQEGFDYFITCALRNTHIVTAMHRPNSIVHTENGFRGVPVAVADRGKRSDQSATMSLAAFPATMCLFPRLIYLITRPIANRDISRPGLMKPGSIKHRSNIDIHTLLAVVTFVLLTPKVDDFPFSIQSTILYALLKLIYYAFVQPYSFRRSVVHSFKTCQQDDLSSTTFAGGTHYRLYLCVRLSWQ